MMTRKDYILVAEILSNNKKFLPEVSLENLIFDFSEMFLKDNSRFDSERFADAVMDSE